MTPRTLNLAKAKAKEQQAAKRPATITGSPSPSDPKRPCPQADTQIPSPMAIIPADPHAMTSPQPPIVLRPPNSQTATTGSSRVSNQNRTVAPDTPYFWNAPKHKALYHKFLNDEVKPKPTLYPDESALKDLEIYEEVKSYLCDSGLTILFEKDPGISARLVVEFVSTFEPVYANSKSKEKKKPKKGKEKVRKDITHWKFFLCGALKTVDRGTIASATKFPVQGAIPDFKREERDKFWQEISGTNEYYVSSNTNGRIKSPVWKVIHRIVSESFYPRGEGARIITEGDMDVMLLIKKKKPVDWIWVLTKGIIAEQNKPAPQGLGGGSFLTLLAKGGNK